MKIQSQDITMQSEHSFSKVEVDTQLSFSQVCIEIEEEKNVETIKQTEDVKAPSRFSSYQNSTSKMLYELIQSLIYRLSQNSSNNSSMFFKAPEIELPTTNENQKVDSSKDDTQIEKVTKKQTLYHTSLSHTYQEDEKLDFSTKGLIQTDNGSLDIDINFSMSRSFTVEKNIDIYSLFDPLVINLDGDIPDLSQDSFSFDLDNDGEKDQISKLGSNSGFLAFDANNDGKINQGSELFGTKTGDGFGELSEYDKDDNNWIDENDPIFDKLQIWLKNEDTNEKELVGLGEVGIGAIYLNSQESEFTYKTQSNETLGKMKSCSFFLKEDGSCGTISQIDLASREVKEPAQDALSKLLQV